MFESVDQFNRFVVAWIEHGPPAGPVMVKENWFCATVKEKLVLVLGALVPENLWAGDGKVIATADATASVNGIFAFINFRDPRVLDGDTAKARPRCCKAMVPRPLNADRENMCAS